VPNRFTQVPDAPVPPPGRLEAVVLPVADAFMLAMFSKPPSGTLRTTWVTPSTFWMSITSCAGAVVIAVLLLSGVIGQLTTISIIGSILCIVFAIGSGSVAIVGAAQHRTG
jgi:hypothetical protein